MRPRLVELVGPAGAGKSTLARDLCTQHPAVRGPLGLWGLPGRTLAASAVSLLPAVLGNVAGRGRLPPWPEFAQMIRLGALQRVIDREAGDGGDVLLLDEGPVFALGWLEVFFPAGQEDPAARWRRRAAWQWARRLDAVVLLDAPDRVLVERIRGRAKRHVAQGWPDAAIGDFSARFRRALARVTATLAAHGVAAATVTSDRGPGETATLVWTRLHETAHA